MNEPVSIIILNYNGKRFLDECISAVLNQSYPEFELIFFDNNSTDGSAEYTVSRFNDSRIKIIKSDRNLGFAGGNNEALKHCLNDLVVLLNNDTRPDANWLRYLTETMSGQNTIASSFVITEGIPEKYYSSNGSVSYMMYNVMNIFTDIEETFYPNGCSVIFRKNEIGKPFDGDYFYYGEDVYLGLKARFSGMKIKFVKNSVVEHYGSGSSGQSRAGREKKTFYSERNRFLNLYLFFSIPFLVRMIPYITLNHTVKIILSIFSEKYSFTGLLRAYFWFYLNIPLVARKRNELKIFKIISEKDVISKMSSKIFNDETLLSNAVNKLSYYYSRLVGLKPVEYYRKNSG